MKITSQDIRVAMLKQFGGTEWAIMWEVAPATGAFSGKSRYADAVMMSLWPSRGLDLHGIEIKISRQDWRREAADPTKAERIAAYCDFWWVHVAPGVIADMSEVPQTWGVREWDGKKWTTRREAVRTEALPVDRAFLASLLRRAEGFEESAIKDRVRKREEELQATFEKRVAQTVEHKLRNKDAAERIIAEFKAASGIDLDPNSFMTDPKSVGAIVRLVQAAGIHRAYDSIRNLARAAKITSDQIEKALAEYDDLGKVDDLDDLLS